jgi:hypothetical protein
MIANHKLLDAHHLAPGRLRTKRSFRFFGVPRLSRGAGAVLTIAGAAGAIPSIDENPNREPPRPPNGIPAMDGHESLSHTKWGCKDHGRGQIRRHLGEPFHRLAAQRESRIEQGHLQRDPAGGYLLWNISSDNEVI